MLYMDKVDLIEFIAVFGLTIALWIISLLAIYTQISVCVKRLHDRNKSGWSLLWCVVLGVLGHTVYLFGRIGKYPPITQINQIIPIDTILANHFYAILGWTLILGILYIVIACGCLKGTKGENKYGLDPSVNL